VIDKDLVSIIKSNRANSLGADDGQLSNERALAMDHYHGRPYGNEQEGRSAVVSKDLAETVDWALPGILTPFIQSGDVVEFDPVGPEDEELAKQEADVTNKVFMQDNNGFMVLHDAIKDALLLKNGYIKHWWEESEEVVTESYTGLTMDEIGMMFADLESKGSEVEIVGQESRQVMVVAPEGQMPLEVFDLKIKIRKKCGKVVCVAVPAEEVRVSKRCRGALSESPFVEHVTRKTRSELIEMGMPRSFVDSLPAYSSDEKDNERLARDSVTDESNDIETSFIDKSMDEIEYCEAYIRVDWDGDGLAELRKVVTVADRIPPGEEWNEEIDMMPMTGGSPKRIPHRHVGESLDDDLADLQEIKTTLFRQMLDNIYATNNAQYVVNERVVIGDFLQSLPGGVKRVKGMEPVSGSYEPVMTAPIMAQIMPAIDYIDSTKEARTGINRATTGLDPDVLKQSTKGAFMENLNRASQKVMMMTRMIGETLVKPTMLSVHALLIKHQNVPMTVRLRGKYVQVNPQEWRNRSDAILRVGIGTGNEEEKREKLMLIASAQQQLAGVGLVGPQQAYNLFADLCTSMGLEMPEKYALSPDSDEFKQKKENPPKNPQIQIEEMKLQADQQKFKAQAALESQKADADMQQEQARSQNDIVIEREKITAQMELERWKAQLEAETKLQIARLEMGLKAQVAAQNASIQAQGMGFGYE
jgi:hypothetical protein